MADLDLALSTVRERIGKYRRQGIGEQDTKAALIVPVLRAIGWDVEDLDEVKLEYRRRSADNPVDFALFLLRTPRLFFEAKALGSNLEDRRWASQILGYATVAGVEWVVLTDGDQYRIYNSHAAVPVEDKLFRRVRVTDPDSHPEMTLALLSKAQMADHLIDTLWKAHFVDRQIRDVLADLFAPEPDASLVRLLRSRLPSLAPAEVRAGLGRLRATFDFPAVPAASVVPSPVARGEAAADSAAMPARRTDKSGSIGAGTPWRHVTLAQLITAGVIRPPFDVEHEYRGHRLTARIEDGTHVAFGNVRYGSLSIAGAQARKSIVGAPAGRQYPQTNGWTFWQYRDADGSLHLVDDLRRRLFEGGQTPVSDPG